MNIAETLSLFRTGRTVMQDGKVIGTIDGTALRTYRTRRSVRFWLEVRVRRTDPKPAVGYPQTIFDSRYLSVIVPGA